MKTIDIYGEIGPGSVTAAEIVPQLDAAHGEPVEMRINSAGGSVFEGQAIAAAVARHGQVTARIDGICASIATLIAVSAARVTMASGALLMIHEPSAGADGTAAEMRSAAELLDKISAQLVQAYHERTSKPEEEIRQAMAAETWYTAAEALEAGLIDAIEGRADIRAEAATGAFSFGSVYQVTAKAKAQPEAKTAAPQGLPQLASWKDIRAALKSSPDAEAKKRAELLEAFFDSEAVRLEMAEDQSRRMFDQPDQWTDSLIKRHIQPEKSLTVWAHRP